MSGTCSLQNETELEEVLSQPGEGTRQILSEHPGDIMVLGAAGKMGPTLCQLLKKASPQRKIYAVSRFSDPNVKERLEQMRISVIACDLANPESYTLLPQVPNIYYLVGMKFGSHGHESTTWAMNAYVPALVCEHFNASKIVALSTGNVYPFTEVNRGGASEETAPDPKGEYAQSCLGRERIFEYFSRRNNLPVVSIRLAYANEPRYGIIVDLTRKILANDPIDLAMGNVNLIWQGDANDYIAQSLSLASVPSRSLNLTGPETVSIRVLAEFIAKLLDRRVTFIGQEESTALLLNASACFREFGYPRWPLMNMVQTIVPWVASGKTLLNKPTKFNVRDGKF